MQVPCGITVNHPNFAAVKFRVLAIFLGDIGGFSLYIPIQLMPDREI